MAKRVGESPPGRRDRRHRRRRALPRARAPRRGVGGLRPPARRGRRARARGLRLPRHDRGRGAARALAPGARPGRRLHPRRPPRSHDGHPRLRRRSGVRRGRQARAPARRRSTRPSSGRGRNTGGDMRRPSLAEVAAPAGAAAETQWTRCPACEAFVYHKRLRRNLGVCPECNFHFRVPVRQRLTMLLDEESFVDRSGEIQPLDVLAFADSRPYADRLADAQRKTGSSEGILFGTADHRRPAAGRRRDGLRVHRGKHGERRRRGDHVRRRARAREPGAAARDRRLGRRPHAGGLRLAHADGEDEPGDRPAARGRNPVRLPPHRSDLRRRDCLVRHPRRRPRLRAGQLRRLRRPEGDRADDSPDAPGRLPDGRVPDGARDARPRRAAREPPSHAPKAAPAPRARRRVPRRPGGRPGQASELRRARPGHRSRPARAAPGLGRGPARPPRRPAELARVHRLRLRRFPGAPRRPPLRRGPVHRRRHRPARRAAAARRGPSEGAHDAGDDGAQLRDAAARGVPQGPAAHALRRTLRHADRHARRHARRLPGRRGRGARAVRRDRRGDHGDGAPARPDRHGRHRRGRERRGPRAGRRRSRARHGKRLLLRHQPRGVLDDPLQGRRHGAAGGGGVAADRAGPRAARDHGGGRSRARGRRPRRPVRPPAANLKAAILACLSELLDVPSEQLLARRYDRFRAFGAPGRQPVLPPTGESP